MFSNRNEALLCAQVTAYFQTGMEMAVSFKAA